MPSRIATVHVTSLLPMELVLDFTLFLKDVHQRAFARAMPRIIVPSEANKDLGTTVNS